MLRGEYVILRVPEGEDINMMSGWQSDREVTGLLVRTLPHSKSDMDKWIKAIEDDECNMVFIIENEDEIPIGVCSLNNIEWVNGTGEVNISIYAKNCWGRGYGYDALKTITNYGLFDMNLHTLYANVIEENEKAIRCFQKAGYEIEGKLVHRIFKDGQYKNLVSLSIVKDKVQEG